MCITRAGAPRFEIRNYDNERAGTIHLSYHDQQHYSSVRPLGDNSQEAANVKVCMSSL